MRTTALAMLGFSFLTVTAFAAKPTHEKTLYARLGGKKTITAVVNQVTTNCAQDKRINSYFEKTIKDPKRLSLFKRNLIDQICEAAGGPCKYQGKDMRSAHKGMGITDEAFHALVEDLVAALDRFKVQEKEKGELINILGPMKTAIVEKRG